MGIAFSVGSISGALRLDDRQWKGAVTRALSDSGRLEGALRRIEDRARSAALGFAAYGTAALGIAGQFVKAAADVEEMESLFVVSMGDMAEATRAWSENLSSTLGLNAVEVRDMVSTLNLMLGSMGLAEEAAANMSKEMVKLAYDMSSAKNVGVEEAFMKISAGLSGETEPLKRWGILVNEATIKAYAWETGIADVGRELTEQQKVVARYGAILDQTNKYQGDLYRTQLSATNQTRRFQAGIAKLRQEIGATLLPAYTALVSTANEWLSTVQAIAATNPELVGSLAMITAETGAASLGLAALSASVYVAVKAFRMLRWVAATAWAAALLPATPLIAAIGAVAGAVYVLRAEFKQNFMGMRREFESFVDIFGDGWDWITDKTGAALKWIWDSFRATINGIIGGWMGMSHAVSSVMSDIMSGSIPDMSKALDAAIEQTSRDFLGEFKEFAVKDVNATWEIIKGAGKAVGDQATEDVKSYIAGVFGGLQTNMNAAIDGATWEGYNAGDPAAMLEGAKQSTTITGAGKAAAAKKSEEEKAAKQLATELERAKEESDRLYLSLMTVQGAVAGAVEDLTLLAVGGHGDANSALAGDIVDRYERFGSETLREVQAGLRETGEAAAELAGMMEEAIVKIEAAEKLDNAEEAAQKKQEKYDTITDGLSGIGAALGRLPGAWKYAGKAAEMASKVMRLAAALSGNAWAAVALAVELVADALGFMGDEAEESQDAIDLMMDDLADAVDRWADSMTDAIVEFVRTGKTEMKDFVDSVVEDLLRIGVSNLVVNPAVSALAGLFGKGAAFSGGNVVPFADGGVVSKATAFGMSGGRVGVMGESGPEAIVPLKRMADGSLGIAGGGGSVEVNVIDQRSEGAPIKVQERNANGRRVLDVFVVDRVREAINRGEFDTDFGLGFGLVRSGG